MLRRNTATTDADSKTSNHDVKLLLASQAVAKYHHAILQLRLPSQALLHSSISVKRPGKASFGTVVTMEQEVGPALCFPNRAKPALRELSRSQLMDLAVSEGINPAGATNGELRDSIAQKRHKASFTTDRVYWRTASVKVEAASQSVSLKFSCQCRN